MAKIYRDAVAAWEAFRSVGGIELADRDDDLEAEILAHIGQPTAQRLDEALRAANTDDLVRALFAAVSPFVEMFRAILEFFQMAGATGGRQQWAIKIDDEHLDLKAFEQFLAAVSSVPTILDVPDVRDSYLRRAWSILREAPGAESIDLFSTMAAGPVIAKWMENYRRGEFPELPNVVSAPVLPPGLEDLRRILAARLGILRKLYGNREAMMESLSRRGWRTPQYDPFHPFAAAQAETDFWAQSILKLLLHAISLPPKDRLEVDQALQREFAGPRRILEHAADAAQLERILSLPVWQRRHELYAVWIATEIVAALPDHDVVLHHEDGRIVFAFKETVVATFKTASPERRLISERRSPLEDPIGAGRRGAVQPDYGIWSDDTKEQCHLIIEVKHYKRAKNRAFREVLQDYARSQPGAQVVLVNHGAVGDVFARGFDYDVQRRCTTIGGLTTRDPDAREQLAKLVRSAVGDPVRRRRNGDAVAALLVDVSGSMRTSLRPAIREQVIEYARQAGVTAVALVDEALVDTIELEAFAALDPSRLRGGATNLGPTAANLLSAHPLLLALTDKEGYEQYEALDYAIIIIQRWNEVYLIELRPKL